MCPRSRYYVSSLTFSILLIYVSNDQLNQPDYLYENDIYDYCIHFQYAQERKKTKKELQYLYNYIINTG